MPLSLLNHSALALFAQRTRIPTSARSIGFCAIWVCISSSSSSGCSLSPDLPRLFQKRATIHNFFSQRDLRRIFLEPNFVVPAYQPIPTNTPLLKSHKNPNKPMVLDMVLHVISFTMLVPAISNLHFGACLT